MAYDIGSCQRPTAWRHRGRRGSISASLNYRGLSASVEDGCCRSATNGGTHSNEKVAIWWADARDLDDNALGVCDPIAIPCLSGIDSSFNSKLWHEIRVFIASKHFQKTGTDSTDCKRHKQSVEKHHHDDVNE